MAETTSHAMLSNKVLVQRKEAGFYVNPAGPLADFIVADF